LAKGPNATLDLAPYFGDSIADDVLASGRAFQCPELTPRGRIDHRAHKIHAFSLGCGSNVRRHALRSAREATSSIRREYSYSRASRSTHSSAGQALLCTLTLSEASQRATYRARLGSLGRQRRNIIRDCRQSTCRSTTGQTAHELDRSSGVAELLLRIRNSLALDIAA
jgi:deferrochelatase/peroxidase EfeB